jgi:hypothetical protein
MNGKVPCQVEYQARTFECQACPKRHGEDREVSRDRDKSAEPIRQPRSLKIKRGIFKASGKISNQPTIVGTGNEEISM